MQRNFKDLKVWHAAIDLAELVYEMTANFPASERFGIINQMRRASISIPSNIAEGCGRGSETQLAHFIDIAQGSAFELETQAILSQKIGFLKPDNADHLFEKLNYVQRLLCNFKKYLSSKG